MKVYSYRFVVAPFEFVCEHLHLLIIWVQQGNLVAT